MHTRDRATALVLGAGALLALAVTVADGWVPGIALAALACALSASLWVTA